MHVLEWIAAILFVWLCCNAVGGALTRAVKRWRRRQARRSESPRN